MRYTDDGKLRLPENDDTFNIEDFNFNASVIDGELAQTAQTLEEHGQSIRDAALQAETNAAGIQTLNTALAGKQAALGFTPVQQGGGAGQGNTKLYLGWTGSDLKAQAGNSDLGSLVTTGSAGAKLPVAKGGTGAATANAALNALTQVASIALGTFCTKKTGSSMSGYAKKIGNRISAHIRIPDVASSANGTLQIATIASSYRPNSTYNGASVGPCAGNAYAGGVNFPVTGYINAGGSNNGIITCVFPAASTPYDYVDLFLDYYCGA